MDTRSVRELEEIVARHDRFVHVTHVNPDADGYGSALAMSRYLRSRGKDSWVHLSSPPPRRLAFLDATGDVRLPGSPLEQDAVFMLYDVASLDRLGPFADPVRASGEPRVVFDHHDGQGDAAGLSFVDPDAGATAQVLLELFEGWHVPLTAELAVPLYVGLLADTGSFNYGKTTPRTHHLAARLLEAGVDPLAVHGELEGSCSLEAVRVAGEVMAGITRLASDPRIAHATLSHAAWRRGGAEAVETLDLVNTTIAIEGVRAGVLFVEAEPGTTRLSLRSKGALSIVETARAFGGGGHRNAAGAQVAEPPDAVRDRVLAELQANVARQLGPD